MEPRIRILVADDHSLVRAGLRSLLEELPGVEVVAEAVNGREALRLIAELRPDVAMLDISMPELNGLEVAARVAKEWPRTRTLILSMHADEEYVRRALSSGAIGYLLKNSARPELEMAIRATARGESWLAPEVSTKVVAAWVRGETTATGTPRLLTPRQREIVQLIAEGRSSKEIAQTLDLSVKTVETHRTELMHRLGIRNVAGLVRFAIRSGMVSADG